MSSSHLQPLQGDRRFQLGSFRCDGVAGRDRRWGRIENRNAVVYGVCRKCQGGAAYHWNHREDDDYYSQPGALFRLMSPAQQQLFFANTGRAMGDAPREIKIRHIGNCLKADPAYGEGVAADLGLPLAEVGGTPEPVASSAAR